ncbi:MAG: hypothetical protein ABJZ55_02915 [Fuerstiella sp.]
MPRVLRNEQFCADEVGVVFVTQRCVRRAWLAGKDPVSGKDFSKRKEWIRRRMECLASVFAVDVLTYAILSNHMHQILRNRPDVVKAWSDEQVAIRWLKVFPGRRIEEQLAEPTDVDVKQLCADKERLKEIRLRLSDVSWFMKALAEPIARMANKHDECTGRFWEGRFKAQKITDEAGLLACSVYVDLNPVRAKMAESPDESIHTSIYDRIKASRGAKIESAAYDLKVVDAEQQGKEIRDTPVEQLKAQRRKKKRNPTGRRVIQDAWLAPLAMSDALAANPEVHSDGLRCSDRGFLNMTMKDYAKLLRWTSVREALGGQETVPKHVAAVLSKHGIESSMFKDLVWNWRRYFGRSTCAGKSENMKSHAEQQGRQYHSGQRQAAKVFV